MKSLPLSAIIKYWSVTHVR